MNISICATRKAKIYIVLTLFAIIFIFTILFLIQITIKTLQSNKNSIYYMVKSQKATEMLEKMFERSEINLNVLSDTITNSYNISQAHNAQYNYNFLKNNESLLIATLSNSPGADGAWIELNQNNAPVDAYTWYRYNNNVLIDYKRKLSRSYRANRILTPGNDSYYFDAIDNRGLTWSDTYIDNETKNSMITVSKPIYCNSKLVGVAGVDISMQNINNAFKNMQSILGDVDLYLYNSNNNLVLLTSKFDKNCNETQRLLFNNLYKLHVEPIIFNDNFIKKTAVLIPLTNNYKLIILFDYNEIVGNTSMLITTMYILFVLVVIITMLLFLYCLKNIKTDSCSIEDKNGTTSDNSNQS